MKFVDIVAIHKLRSKGKKIYFNYTFMKLYNIIFLKIQKNSKILEYI